MTIRKPRAYCNNRDLLSEIHLSKVSYCTFLNKTEDHQQDLALSDISQLTEDTATQNSAVIEYYLRQAKINRANRLKDKENTIVAPESIDVTELVFRVPTWSHIPLAPPKPPKNPPKKPNLSELFDFDADITDEVIEDEVPISTKYVRLNFAPFFHYRLTSDRKPVIVGKSHWRGSLEDGEFCKTHGQLTDKLARMMLMMVERYSTRGNWRSYSYIDEMRGHAVTSLIGGGLQFDECRGANPFAFYTTVITNAFTGILLNERKTQNIRDDLLEMNGLNPSFTRQNMNSYNFADKHGPVEVIKFPKDEV